MASKTRIVVVGGSFAGLEVLSTFSKHKERLNLDIILVEPHNHFHYNLAFVRAVTQPDFAEKCFIPLANATVFTSGAVKHVRARVSKALDDRVVLEDGEEIAFDYLVVATGSRFGVPGRPSGDTVHEVTRQLVVAREAVERARRILVVGTGAVGIELAGELTDLPGKEVTLVGSGLLAHDAGISDRLRDKLRDKLTRDRGVRLVLGTRVQVTAEQRAAGYVDEKRMWHLANGEQIEADLMFTCTGHTGLNTELAESLGGGDGDGREQVIDPGTQAIRVRPTMQLRAHDHIFAVGDCNDYGRKLAFVARQQAAMAANNLLKLVRKRATTSAGCTTELDEFKPMDACIVTLGARDGAAQLPYIGTVGRTLAVMLKGKDFMLRRNYKQLNATAPSF
ncbi:hypothetical protein SYNPS1DRAFT_24663 [Syncephalis pseudoplumigaleata]|uniref:FAD/NAD(P)-binding domain-containing protein n=1 Tax=Syncephalis pseudoplumigaleata TaxID=1712513 RepID=A0A4P9YU80_9FUNG|nr:hypothetical protein SYNPS1DRAFT_24663 [Syncephalis pseudoplumigaleata]|eukprot:RKP23308.1 hypothetical protein SYNPS1DRAFT_24663 [Syncephalis pseudoplumigaleata]